MQRIRRFCVGRDQPVLLPVVLYEQAANIGKKPGAGSVRVPLKDPADVIVPRSSIANPPDAARIRAGVVTPVLRFTEPLSGRTTVDRGFCQKLVALLSVPSASTSKCAVSTWPSASDPLEQVRALVGCTVNDQLPAASAWVTPPDPPMPINGSVLFSQAATERSTVRQRTVDLT